MKDWLTAKEAAAYAKCGVQSIYNGVKRRKLRAAKMNGTGEYRFLHEWIDEWLEGDVTVVEPEPMTGRYHS